MVTDGPCHPNGTLPFESLCLQDYNGEVVRDFIGCAVSRLPRLRSLKYCSNDYSSLHKLLASCSTTLVNLFLDLRSRRSCMFTLDIPLIVHNIHTLVADYYDFNKDPPTIKDPEFDIPPILSMLPYLVELSIHSNLQYSNDGPKWGLYSPIPTITKLLFSKHPSSLKHLTLDFKCVIYRDVRPQFPLSLSVSDVVCLPLYQPYPHSLRVAPLPPPRPFKSTYSSMGTP